MKTRLLAASAHLVVAATLFGGCTGVSAEAATPAPATAPAYSGPFAQESTLPFHAPDFSTIKDSDYQPALEAGIAAKRAEIEAIADNPAAPTFDNTIVAMDRAGSLLSRVEGVFDQLVSANTNETLDATDTAMSPKREALKDEIYLNGKLFARVKAVHDDAEGQALTGEDAMLLGTTYAKFVHRGAELDAAHKAQLKKMNLRIAALETEFSQKLTAGTDAAAVVFDGKADLAGLSDADIAAAARRAADKGMPGKYVLALINTTQQPALSQLTNRESRRKLFEASVSRTSHGGEFDTTAIVTELATLRAEKARLLGLPDYATFQMYDRMVTAPKKAMEFMTGFVPALGATQSREAAILTEAAAADGIDALQPWDWGYYAEKVRKAKFDLDDAQIKPYFDVWNTLENGVFYAATQTYGITFKRRTDLPVYHQTMRVYEVHDKDGSPLALFYFDPYARPNKQGGAWMTNFVEQSYLLGDKPVVVNTLNITPPSEGQPPLATWDDVTTMFHEFGHALHGMFASQKYPSLSGTNTARDFVEFPSQFNENFATVPSVLQHFAKHYQTGETIPDALMQKIEAAAKWNQGLGFGETLEAAMLDMHWHTLTPEQASQPPMAFEAKVLGGMNAEGLRTDLIPPRYRTPYFRHIWSNGYSAGYYAYIWTEMLAHDGWDWVEKNGGMTRANGDHIRATFLGQGHSKDYSVMYHNFTGHDPELEPMLEARGLTGGK
ncbi:M3 family metallopeptidase [Novosphingobium mangrovi (ex Huang et al. 2023)]|uniref:M3 family metallopeptidase n=1 Tax=Novosphingobium mangrovi (ex Huang et al. 2023) TaxID=2976432 RepID=A0ABT2I4Y2_9SPHN|nr:M3 family metallopeptidase [Novosphingobium mangrovi (ex Huang et al. 2023)]MCT2399850.1 M3 family metallopeptidase [Novosphingobium mangrovi (ex Huang et al. 2023)]